MANPVNLRDLVFAYFPSSDNKPAAVAPAGGAIVAADTNGGGGTITVAAGDYIVKDPVAKTHSGVAAATFKSQHNLP